MRRYTPGPWKVKDFAVLSSDDRIVCEPVWGPDAPLIAAAPELLAVCKAYLTHEMSVPDGLDEFRVHDSRSIDIRHQLREAIAKADDV